MTGVEQFVDSNFSEPDSTFRSCLNLIIYSYFLLEKKKKYSRSEIQKSTTAIRGKTAKKVELEDFLRNDLVIEYINPNRVLFGLKDYLFHPGADEIFQNVRTGILDIKVCSPLFNGDVYYIFECKRLNKKIIDNYVKEGVLRFTNGQYYPNEENSIAGMISFLESDLPKNKIDCSSVYNEICSVFAKYKGDILMEGTLEKYQLSSDEFKEVGEYDYVYKSAHRKGKKEVDIFHVFLDYNHIVMP